MCSLRARRIQKRRRPRPVGIETTITESRRTPDVALTIYGSPKSRTMRVLWAAEELGLEFAHVPYEFDDPRLKAPEFLRLNPNGTIPAIVDDAVMMSESLAINLYLAKKYGSPGDDALYATTPAEEAAIWQWTLWAQGHLEPWVQKDRLLADLIRAIGRTGDAMVGRSLYALETVLERHAWLIGPRFTVGDLNVAAVLSPSRAATLDLTHYPHVAAWLTRCYSRPAAVRVRNRFAV